jgi:UDP-N-acetylglucosamine--N-acetylmuramyl-(pentapeptide) pyrophosphoryl-undecaprenol N-acetylglucosamine transferase
MQTNLKALHIVIAGGGTGGHLFPGIAVAEALKAIDPANKILFLGTDRPLEKKIMSQTSFSHAVIPAGGLKGLTLKTKIQSLLQIPKGVLKAIRIYNEFVPHIVLGVGGYVSAPCVLAANLMGIPVVIQEQNSIPGLTNRMLAKTSDRIFVSFPQTVNWFMAKKTVYTGNPVRKKIVVASKKLTKKTNDSFTVFIVGGSQGSSPINKAIIDSLEHLKNQNVTFIHQSGPDDESILIRAYKKQNIQADVRPFFHDMITPYQQADLIICRAGATTVAELSILGKPAIFIPFPHAADDHQVKNAQAIVDAGGAEMIIENQLSGYLIADRIRFFSNNQGALETMHHKSLAFARPDAADQIAKDCYQLSTLS